MIFVLLLPKKELALKGDALFSIEESQDKNLIFFEILILHNYITMRLLNI